MDPSLDWNPILGIVGRILRWVSPQPDDPRSAGWPHSSYGLRWKHGGQWTGPPSYGKGAEVPGSTEHWTEVGLSWQSQVGISDYTLGSARSVPVRCSSGKGPPLSLLQRRKNLFFRLDQCSTRKWGMNSTRGRPRDPYHGRAHFSCLYPNWVVGIR